MGSDKAWLETLAAGSGVSTLAGGSYGLGTSAYWVQRTHSPGHHQHGGHCPGAGAQYPQGLSAPALKSCLPFDSKLRIWWAPEGPLDYGSPGGPSTLREEICLLPAHSTRARGFFVSSVLCLPAWATTVTSVSEGEVMFGPP